MLFRSISISRKLAFPRRIVPVADYQAFKNDLERIAHSSKQKIFLEENEAKPEPAQSASATVDAAVNASATEPLTSEGDSK